MEATLIDLTKPLTGVTPEYTQFATKARELQVEDGGKLVPILTTADRQNVVTNYAYIIFEYLDLNKTREGADYSRVKEFAERYKNWLNYILDGKPVRYKMNMWLQEPEEIVELGMYSGTNRYNKNTYH